MKTRFILAILTIFIAFYGCSVWGVRGNGRIKDQNRNVSEFNRIDAGGAFTIKVEVGKAPSVRIAAEENLLGYIRTSVKGNTLVIDTKKNLSPRKEIKILITTPSLSYIEASGANDIRIIGIKGDSFEANLSGAGTLDLSGEAKRFDADLSGAGTINAKDLIARNVSISVSGAASAEVFAKETLDASVSGVGSISYYGNPENTKTTVSGVGSINRK